MGGEEQGSEPVKDWLGGQRCGETAAQMNTREEAATVV